MSQALSIRWQPEGSLLSYEQRYGLAERPFSATPDQRFLFRGRSYGEVLREVTQALQRREGMVIVTGDVGTGKTMLCRTLLQHLDTPTFVSMVLDARVTVEELLVHMLVDFGVIRGGDDSSQALTSGATRHQLVALLQRFLATLIRVNGSAVVIIDEAQQLGAEVIEQLRLLSNFETDEAKLLQVVLVGLPDLDRMLQRPEMRQIDQRVGRRCVLERLSRHEIKRYVDRRLSTARKLAATSPTPDVMNVAPSDGEEPDTEVDTALQIVRFTPAAIRSIARVSRGNLRVVNLLCDRSLEIGHERTTGRIDRNIVRAAAGRLNKRAVVVPSSASVLHFAIAAVSTALLLGGSGAWLWASQSPGRVEGNKSGMRDPGFAIQTGSESGDRGSGTGDVGSGMGNRGSAVADGASGIPDLGSRTTDVVLSAEIHHLPIADAINLHVASADAADARELSAELKGIGLPAFILPGASRDVIVGPYATSEEAGQAQRLVAQEGFLQSRILVEGGASLAAGNVSVAGMANPNGTRVLFLTTGNRASVVLELSSEPRQVQAHRIGDNTLDVDLGSVVAPIGTWLAEPSTGPSLVQRLSIEETAADSGERSVRARLIVAESSRSNVRVVGRRVYLDLAPAAALKAKPPSVGAAAAVQPAGAPAAPNPVLARFEEIAPFLLSAVAVPQPSVLKAMAGTLNELGQTVRTQGDGLESAAHELLISAVTEARRAVDPEFTGDRAKQAEHAIAMFQDAKQLMSSSSF